LLEQGRVLFVALRNRSLSQDSFYCAGAFAVGFLELINNMLTSGMVPALYNDEEKEQIIGQVCCKTSASCSGSMLYDRFIGRHASFVQLYPI